MYYLNEITQLEELINKVSAERFELRKSNDLKVQQVFDRNFNYFKEFDIKVSGESAYFQIKNDNGILVDLFSIYFYERYREERKLELSYYTTNTQSDFELNRVILLGQTARILRDNSEIILKEIAEVKKSDLERENELYRIQDGYEKEKRSYQNANDERRKVEIELSLKGEGVHFNRKVSIDFKYNYSANIRAIKLINVSKSGKTADVAFNYNEGDEFRYTENNCNVQRMIEQVMYFKNNIVSALELV
jgi:hypothetical protein